MKRLLTLIPLVFLCCFGCQQAEEVDLLELAKPSIDSEEDRQLWLQIETEADIQAIKDIIADYNAALNAADVDRMMMIYADDAIEIRPNQPAFFGTESIRSSKQQMFNDVNLTETDEVKIVNVSGDLAVAYWVWSADATLKESGEPINSNGSGIRIFERQPDNGWKCIYSIWSNESLILPDEAE